MVQLAWIGTAAALLGMAHGVRFTFQNKCSFQIDLYDNANVKAIASGGSHVVDIGSGRNGMFRNGRPDQATLFEYSIADGKTWFDISAVPPGSANCKSPQECATLTGRTGFNTPMAVVPASTGQQGSNCRTLTCEHKFCTDAYLWPTDDSKTHNCPESVPMTVVFCPSGNAQQTPTMSVAARSASVTTAAATTKTTTASAATTTTATAKTATTNQFRQIGNNYQSGTVKPTEAAASPAQSTAATSSSQNQNNQNQNSSAKAFPNANIKSVFSYRGKLAGNIAGKYQMVTNAKSCTKQTVSVNSPVGPLSEEVTMVFRGPMNIYNIAVFDGSSGGDWKRVSSYSSSGTQDLVFMNNKNVDYSGGFLSPQGLSTADGLAKTNQATQFKGYLAEASNPSQIGAGPGIQTGAEVNIMRASKCTEEKTCKGYYDDRGYHGWNGGKKMFVTKVKMPQGAKPNQPAIWMLNAQIVRSNQYGCNCRNMGGSGGCGELDIAEVIETNAARDKVTTHYYFYDGQYPAGRDNFAPRPTNAPTTYLTIIDDSGEGTIQILEIGENDFDFSAGAVTNAQIKAWLAK